MRQPHTGAVHASLTIYLQRPARQDGKEYPLDGGDVDNYAKMVLDAFNGLLYLDDKQVVSLNVQKRFYSAGEGGYRTEMKFLLDIEDDTVDLTV